MTTMARFLSLSVRSVILLALCAAPAFAQLGGHRCAYDFGGGVQNVKESGRAFTFGYQYQHISNGYHAPNNTGIDVQMLYAGFSIFK